MVRIFLHASEDKVQVHEAYYRLRAIAGFEPWLDEEDLLPDQEWAREIPRALQTSDCIFICLSRTSGTKGGYVQRKMKLALDALQEFSEGTIHTITVRLNDCDVPESFRRYHWVDLFAPTGFDRIICAIRARGAKRPGAALPPMPHALPRTSRIGWPAMTDTAVEHLLTNSIGMEFVLIPAGTFMIGPQTWIQKRCQSKDPPTVHHPPAVLSGVVPGYAGAMESGE